MSRRGGHDRYRTRDLQRGIVRDGYTAPRSDYNPYRPYHEQVAERARFATVDCLHGVPWTTCELCSKPRSKR